MKPASREAATNRAIAPDDKKTTKVLVATENGFIIEAIRGALRKTGIALEFADDGRKAVEMAGRTRPDLLILDAAIQGVFSFEVCDILRKDGRLGAMRIIMTSAVYNKNRYKRKPADLFGADEYMEAHCLERELPARAGALLGLEIASVPEGGTNGPAEARERNIAAACGGGHDKEAKAKRLARVIASDIMLYYGGKLGKKAAVEDAFLVLKEEIEEGLKYFREKAPGSSDSYLHDALRERLDSAFAGTAKKLVAELKAMGKPAERT
ncbi:MAG: response regulator [Thermodesulfobacteriota bacterium]|nr:MAG: response regulator [Thermodesulfobacteriota bacterium]